MMIKKREVIVIAVAIVLMTLLLSFNNLELDLLNLGNYLLISLIIILVSVIVKEITANYVDAEIEFKTWEFSRFGVHAKAHLKNPWPVGVLLPLVLSLLSGGFIKFLAFLEFNAKALPSKVVKKFGLKRFSGIMEWDDALISFYSLLAVLLIAVISSFLNASIFPFHTLAKYSLYYSIYNMIPFGKLDGNKIFFGSRPLYVFSLVLLVVAGLFVFF